MKTLLVLLLLIPSLSWGDLKHNLLGCDSLSKNEFIPSQFFYFKNNKLFHLILPVNWDTDVLMVELDYLLNPSKILIYDNFKINFESEIDRKELTYFKYGFDKKINCQILQIDFENELEFKNHFQKYFDEINERITNKNKI